MNRHLSALALSISIPVMGAHAEADSPNLYAGVGSQVFDLDSNNGAGSNDDLNTTAITLIGGVELNRYLAIEGEFDIGVSKQDVTASRSQNISVEAGLSTGASFFARASYPLGDSFSVSARAGFTSYTVEVRDPNNAGSTFELDDSGFALGVGLAFDFGDDNKNRIRVDFTERNLDNLPTQTYGIAYVRKF